MNIEEKKKYVAPEMDVIDMECHTILCDSNNPDELIIEDEGEG